MGCPPARRAASSRDTRSTFSSQLPLGFRAGALTAVLAASFPSEADRLEAVALESSLSRLYAGIHYRFDMEAGLAIGRAAAALALSANLDEVAPLPQ